MGRRLSAPINILISAARIADDALDYHCSDCPRCTRARRDNHPMQYCEVGWILAKSATRAGNLLADAREREAGTGRYEQLAMF